MAVYITISIAVLVSALIVRFVARLSRRRSRPAADPGVPTFRVVALGPRGAGKTMLLASMYEQLQTGGPRSYFLSAPYEEVMLLNGWYNDVSDPQRDWPSGTSVGDTRNFTFTVQTRVPSGTVHPVMNISYLEYAGGLLTDIQVEGSTAQRDLIEQVKEAHALIILLDGSRIRLAIDGRAEGLAGLHHSLTAMVGLTFMASCPVTFVITKWDLLRDIDDDENSRLQTVRKYLMSNQRFRDLATAFGSRRVVRLIPVSAVGYDFAEIGPDGSVTKLPEGQIHPTNVDVPLAAVVPDLFEQIHHDLEASQLSAALDRVRKRARLGPGAALAELGSFVALSAGRALSAVAPYAAFVGDASLELLGLANQGKGERIKHINEQVDSARREIDEVRSARRRVLRDFQSRVDVLEGRLPSSRLSRED
jgi:hypothetical protein